MISKVKISNDISSHGYMYAWKYMYTEYKLYIHMHRHIGKEIIQTVADVKSHFCNIKEETV